MKYNILEGARDCNNCIIASKFDKLQKQATTDELTGLNNRKPLEEKIKKHIEIKKKYWTNSCILMIDIDNFKQINDNYWHSKWDKVLIEVSKLFKLNLRLEDVVWRWWGEEFLIILPSTNIIDWEITANKIRKSIEENLNKNVLIDRQITISIWVTEILESDETWKKAQDRSDIALYEAKNNWRNRVCINLINPWEKRKRRKED